MADDSEHPALKNYSSTVETVKETGMGALKGALWGALIGGGLALLGGVVLGGLLGGAAGFGVLSMFTAPLGAAAGGGLVASLGGVSGAAILGAKIGGAVGAVRGLAGAGEVVEQKKQQLIDNYERNEMRQERREAMAMRREMTRMSLGRQGQALGVSPNALPRGMSEGRQMA